MNNKYQTILVDPPWQYGIWGTNSGHGSRGDFSGRKDVVIPMPYPTMTVNEIKALPVNTLADNNCELYLWTTQKYLPHAFDVIKDWGFKYCQTLIWCKQPRGTGQGGIYCPTNEFLLLGRIGKAPIVKRIDSTWFLTKRPHNSHSTKPEFYQDMIEQVSNPPRIELFARRKRLGWDSWGNEVDSDIEMKVND
jgi:N6-adenosine-specific RNA methylase IME4